MPDNDPPLSYLPVDDGQIDPYIDPASGVLRNKPGLTSWEELKQAEAAAVRINWPHSFNLAVQSVNFCKNRPGYHMPLKAHVFVFNLGQIHKRLFSTVYDWAGEFRTIPISRADEKPCFNACPETLEQQVGVAVRDAIHDPDFLADIGKHYTELNYQHPFREGNGRTQKVFFSALAQVNGAFLDWTKVEKEPYEAALRHWNKTADTSRIDAVLQGALGPAGS
jgi:cell filamentation protein